MSKFQKAVGSVIRTKSTVNLMEARLDEIDEEKGITLVAEKSKTVKKIFKSAVKKVAHHDPLNLVELQSVSKRVLYPRKSSSTLQKVPVIGGVLITEEIAKKLKCVMFGASKLLSSIPQEWMDSAFSFHPISSANPWSMKVPISAVKGLALCVQGYVLKNLLFTRRRSKLTNDIKVLMKPDVKAREESLAAALSDILWKVGDKQRATICLLGDRPSVENSENFIGDGVTERLIFFHYKKQDELNFNMKKFLFQFLKDEGGTGMIQFLYSLILTRGFDRLVEDMETSEPETIILPNNSLHPCIITLMLTGRATPNLHNGIIYEGTEDTMAVAKTGILLRSEIGLLVWNGTKSAVGSRLKTPTFPLWITYCNENYGILFNPNKDLMRDYHAENRFDLLYFSDDKNEEVARLSIDTKQTSNVDAYSSPPLDLLIQSKWQDAIVTWTSCQPYL